MGGEAQIGDIAAPIIPEIPLIIAAAAALPGLMGRSACTLGEDSTAAAALDRLLAAGGGNSPGGGGSLSTPVGIVRSIFCGDVGWRSCLWPLFSVWYLLYGRWGGTKMIKK